MKQLDCSLCVKEGKWEWKGRREGERDKPHKLLTQVMDEADRLLDPSFAADLEVIFDAVPSSRQTLLFSATLTESLSRLRQLALNKPFYWEAPAEWVQYQYNLCSIRVEAAEWVQFE